GKPLRGRLGPLRQFRQHLPQSLHLVPRCLGLGSRLLQREDRLSLLGLQPATIGDQGRALGLQSLPGLVQFLDVGPQRLLATSQLLAALLQLRLASVQVAAECRQLLLALLANLVDLRPPGLELGTGRLVAAGLLVEGLLPLGQLLGAASQLLLERGEDLLGAGQHGSPLAKGLTICPQALLLLVQLGNSSLHQRGLFLLFGGGSLQFGAALLLLLRLGDQPLLGLTQLRDRRLQRGAALLELPVLLVAQPLLRMQLLSKATRLGKAFLNLDLGALLAGALLAEGLFLAAVIVAEPLQAHAQGGEHRLLSFEGGVASGQLGASGLEVLLLLLVLLRLLRQPGVALVKLRRLLLQLARVPLKCLEAMIDFEGLLLQLALPLLQGGGQPVETDEVGLV